MPIYFEFFGYKFLPQSMGEVRRGLQLYPHPPSNFPRLAQAPLRFSGGEQENQVLIRLVKRMFITLLFTIFFFSLHALGPDWIFSDGADGWYMANLVESSPWSLYYRSLLTILIHSLFYTVLHPFGVSGWNAIAWSSSLAGAIAVQILFAIRRDPVFLAVNLLSGSFLVFVGHVENYAWINAFFLLALWQTRRYLETDAPLWPAMVFYILACLSHMLALFYMPAWLYVVWKKPKYHPYEILLPLLGFIGLILGLSCTSQMLGTDVGLERLVPWFHKWAPNQFFTFFSWDHWEILWYFHRQAAFLGLPIELPLLFFLRKRIDTPYRRFLLLCVLCGLFWTTIWHPDWGRLDWDLFGQFGIPLHALLGLILCRKEEHELT